LVEVLLIAAVADLNNEMTGMPLNAEEVVYMLIRTKLANYVSFLT
jgi:hypothetical protein